MRQELMRLSLGRNPSRRISFFLLITLISVILLPVLAAEVTKVYVSAGEDVSIMAPPELADQNFGQDVYLVSGYLYSEVKYCSGGPCMILLENQPAITLLKFEIPQTEGELSSVELHLPVKGMEYYLPSNDLSDLCRFSVALVDVSFSESKVTWEELSDGVPWDPEEHLNEIGTFYVTPENSTPLVLDLTDYLKDLVKPGAEIRLAIAPSPKWWEYSWDEDMGCSIYMTSSESGGAPVLLLKYGEEEAEEAPMYIPIIKPWAFKLPKVPFNVGGEEQEPIPLPEIPPKEIPKLQPKIEPPPGIPEQPELSPPEEPKPPAQEYPPTFSLIMQPALVSVAPGSSAAFTVEVIPHYGFSDWVSLEVVGGPSGSEVQVSPEKLNPIAAIKPEAKVVVNVPEWVPAGNYLIKVVGKGGQLEDSASAWLQVKPITAPQPQPQPQPQPEPGGQDFYLVVDSLHYSTVPGRAVTIKVEVKALAGFSSPVELSLANLPPKSMYLVHGSPIQPGDVGVVRILPSKETPLGSYKLMIVGSSGDLTRSVETILYIGSTTTTTPPLTTKQSQTSMTQSTTLKLILGSYLLETAVGVPVRTKITVSSGQQGKISLEFNAPEDVKVHINKTKLDPGESTLIYLTANVPGTYEVRLRAYQLKAKDEKVLRLRVKGESPSIGAKSRTLSPASRTPPTQEGAETRISRPSRRQEVSDLGLILLALVIILLTILVFALMRRRTGEE